jgi:hypothetical protein
MSDRCSKDPAQHCASLVACHVYGCTGGTRLPEQGLNMTDSIEDVKARLVHDADKGAPYMTCNAGRSDIVALVAHSDEMEARVLKLAGKLEQYQVSMQTPPACKGKNCGATDGKSHSEECFAEHAAIVSGVRESSGWMEAVIDACTIAFIDAGKDSDPRQSISTLIDWHVGVALDPKVSEAAQDLIDSGKVPVMEALISANDMCRSMYAIASRKSDGTEWGNFKTGLLESLLLQHKVMYPHVYEAPTEAPTEPTKEQVVGITQEGLVSPPHHPENPKSSGIRVTSVLRNTTGAIKEVSIVYNHAGKELKETLYAQSRAQEPVTQTPVAYMWQHDETGRTGFIDQFQMDHGWQKNNPRCRIVHKLGIIPELI